MHRLCQSQDEAEQWTKDLEKNDIEDAYLALLLPSLPNLKHLKLFVPHTLYVCNLIERIVKREKPFHEPQSRVLSSLETIVYDYDETPYGHYNYLAPEFLHLPSLREFYGHSIGRLDSHIANGLSPMLRPACISFPHLDMLECNLKLQDLTILLQSFKQLKSFVYRTGYWSLEVCSYTIRDIQRALKASAHSLEKLWLDYKAPSKYWPVARNCLSSMTSPGLSEFRALRKLRIGMWMLFGEPHIKGRDKEIDPEENAIAASMVNNFDVASLLPPSIEVIYISFSKKRAKFLIAALERFLAQKSRRGCLPNLKCITFEDFPWGDEKNRSSLVFNYSRLDIIAQEAQVEVRRIKEPHSVDYAVDERRLGHERRAAWAWEIAHEDLSDKTGSLLYENTEDLCSPDCVGTR